MKLKVYTIEEIKRLLETGADMHEIGLTHDGASHADEVMAILIALKANRITGVFRTRNTDIITACARQGAMIVDVSRHYDGDQFFDHHQPGGGLAPRHNGIPYAASGMVWKHLGLILCEGDTHVHQWIDEHFIQHIDGQDTGRRPMSDVKTFSDMIRDFNPLPDEDTDENTAFKNAVFFADGVLYNELRQARAIVHSPASSIIKGLSPTEQIVVLPKCIWKEHAVFHPALLFVIYPQDGAWFLQAVPEKINGKNRRLLPESWRHHPERVNADVSISGCTFVHDTGFLAVFETQEEAVFAAQYVTTEPK